MIVTLIALSWLVAGLALIVWGLGNISGYSRGEAEGYNRGWEDARKFYGVEGALEDELREIIDSEGGAA